MDNKHLFLLDIRKNRKITQQKVAEAVGISVQNYSHYERNETQPEFSILCKLADFFEVSVDELLGRVSEPLLFDDARVERPEYQTLYEQLTPHQQELVIERMHGYLEANKESAEKSATTSQYIVHPVSEQRRKSYYNN